MRRRSPMSKPKLTPVERAFAAHFRRVCFDARHHPLTDEVVCATWHEALADWVVAVAHGQKHPDAGLTPSRLWGKRAPQWLPSTNYKEADDEDVAGW